MTDEQMSTLWESVRATYDHLAGSDRIIHNYTRARGYQQLTLNLSHLHYEWNPLFSQRIMRVCFDAEQAGSDRNQRIVDAILQHRPEIERKIGLPLLSPEHNPSQQWARVCVYQRLVSDWPTRMEIDKSARLMHQLIQATKGIIEKVAH